MATLGQLAITGAVVLGVYVASLIVLRSPELREVLVLLRDRLRPGQGG